MKKNIFVLCLIIIFAASGFGTLTQEYQYIKAKVEKNSTEMKNLFEKVYEEDHDSLLGQRSLLELAKLNFFKREYKQAVSFLKKIHHQEISDKQYWLAKSYLKMGQYQRSIVSSQIFIADSDDYVKIENAYFLLAEAYLQQQMYKRLFNTLESLRISKYINNNIPLLHYKMGICKEKEGKYKQALMFYKKLKQDFPYHQYCYLAEDRIYNLKKNDKLEIDLIEINTFRKEKIVEESKAATGEDLKIYLQVGAFRSEDRAVKLGKKIKVIGYKYIVFSKIKDNNKLHVVAAGPFDENNDLKKAIQKLKKNDINSFVIKRY